MTVLGIHFLIGVFGFSYLILGLLVNISCPPFYEKGNLKEEMKLDLPYILLVAVLVSVSVVLPHVFGLLGIVSGWIEVRVRHRVQKRTSGPLLWLLNPLTTNALRRWPMLLFDVWTIGLAGLMVLGMLAR